MKMNTKIPKEVFVDWYKSLTETIPVEIKVGGKEDLDPRNWDKPSKAVVASDGMGNGCVLFHCGAHIDEEINSIGRALSSLGLDDCPDGVWVWEGVYRGITHPSTPNGPEEYDTECVGGFKEPDDMEWMKIRNNICPWDKDEWLKSYVSEADFLRTAIEEEKKRSYGPSILQPYIADWIKQEDKAMMANYDPCIQINVAALQKQEDKKLLEAAERLSFANYSHNEMTGDCVAQCLNCVWQGFEGYACTCGSPMMSMDSNRIREEKENGVLGRQQSMKNCSACRAGLPLGSGRHHYDEGDITVPCTHNPITGEAYPKMDHFDFIPPMPNEYQEYIERLRKQIQDTYAISKDYFILDGDRVVARPVEHIPVEHIKVEIALAKCDCGGERANTTHSDWCSKGGTK